MRLFQYLHGSIKVRLIGNTPERFLNICNANGIEIWNVEHRNGTYYFDMFPKDFKAIREVVHKTSMRPVIVEKYGLPFLLFRYRKHPCFAVGIMLSFFMFYLLSLYIWDIDFDGNLIYTDDTLMNFLQTIEVAPGMMSRKVDCDEIEKCFRREFSDITWVSAEISGTRLLIHIKENDEDVLQIPDDTPCDLTATRDGTVESIITRSGTPLVKPGTQVQAGDILVSGIVNTYDDYETLIASRSVHADADIYIRTVYEYESKLNKLYEYKIYTGNSKQIYYFDWNGRLFYAGIHPQYENCQVISTDRQVKLTENFFLPLRYGKKEYVEYYVDTDFYKEEEAERILSERFSIFLENLAQKGVQILENNVKIYVNTSSYSYTGQIVVLEPAFVETGLIELTEGTGQDEYR
jgi:similar to stage IV sporulation protein